MDWQAEAMKEKSNKAANKDDELRASLDSLNNSQSSKQSAAVKSKASAKSKKAPSKSTSKKGKVEEVQE